MSLAFSFQKPNSFFVVMFLFVSMPDFRHVFIVLTVSAAAQVILASVHSHRSAGAPFEIVDGEALYNLPAFFAAYPIVNDRIHLLFPFSIMKDRSALPNGRCVFLWHGGDNLSLEDLSFCV